MRSHWWVVAVLAALWACVAATALRNTQVENEFRIRRRFSSEAPDEDDPVTNLPDVYSIRPRSARRRESTTQNDSIRTRTRSRVTSQESANSNENETPRSSPQTERNERVSNYRNAYMRTRKKPIEATTEARDKISRVESVTTKEPNTVRSRLKQRTSFRSPIENTAPTSERTRVTQFKSQNDRTSSTGILSTTHFRPRSRTTIPNEKVESTTQRRFRGRVNARVTPPKPLPDQHASGSTITENIMLKDAITSRSTLESRNSRKLRYKTRLTDNNANVTDEGISLNNEVTKSSQNTEYNTSQEETNTTTKTITEELRSSTEVSNPTSSTQESATKQPLTRGKINFRPSSILSKTKSETSEISEDDNYPESFKALLQAKAGAPQLNSSSRESLSVIASQKVFKTYTPPSRTYTGSDKRQKYRRFYKQEIENKTNEASTDENKLTTTSTSAPLISKQFRKPDLKNRTSYLSKYRKTSTFTPSFSSTTKNPENSSERLRYRFNRKFKASSTESSKSTSEVEETTPKTAFVRPSYYSRLRSARLGLSSTEETDNSLNSKSESTESTIITKTDSTRSIINKVENKNVTPSTNKPDSVNKQAATLGVSFFHSRNLNKSDIESLNEKETVTDNETNKNDVYVIPLKENERGHINNEVNNIEESEKVEVYHVTTPRYHSSYRDETHSTTYLAENVLTTVAPPIRNHYTRKFAGRKQKEPESAINDNTPAHNDMKKYTDTYSKSTTAMMNGITSEPEKYKSRYSSKYRGSVDRPMYRPTIPSVTPSTAWLKFYVTDKQLTNSFQDPDWFDEEYEIKATPMKGHYIIATSPIIHESSIESVEGEESILGPIMNSISFSPTRSTLASADLKLSESVLASSHVMNFEALQHSQSVTVSIFDALADILTSTPKPKLSSTTDVAQKTIKTEVLLQTVNGVSNKVNVNNKQGLESQEAFVSSATDINTSTKAVQITDQITQNVINQLSVEENKSPSLNIGERMQRSRNTPPTTQPPTTPLSARKPFAIKLLYSDTEPPTDTFTTEIRSSTTDNPTMVYNTVSDLILSNNNLVSSDLTNMLSNNIKSILQNMDENTRSKVSGEMANLLRALIPRALDSISVKSDDVDYEPNTTPYSLEDIKDTENIETGNTNDNNTTVQNIDIQDNNNKADISQTIGNVVTVNIDNIIKGDFGGNIAVNNPVPSSNVNISSSDPSNQDIISIETDDILPVAQSPIEPTLTTVDTTFNPMGQETTDQGSSNDSTDENAALPVFTNFQVNSNENKATTSLQPTFEQPPSLGLNNEPLVSPAQLWLLSKKARLLNMIEELIQQHNIEITTNPSSEILTIPPSSFSSRIAQMVLKLNISTDTEMTKALNEMTSDMTTVSTSENPSTEFPTSAIPTTTLKDDEFSQRSITNENLLSSTTSLPVATTTELETTPSNIDDAATTFKIPDMTTEGNMETSSPINLNTETTTQINLDTTVQVDLGVSSRNSFDLTTQNNIETTTEGIVDTTTVSVSETTPTSVLEITTLNNIQNDSNATGINILDTTSPKKDYVIFGILPNNTVVRKDPNDNVLESLTEASPYIIYGVLPNNTIIRKFPNGTRVPRVMQKIDILPISPWSLKNPYSPIHNNPAIVKPRSNPIRVSTNVMTTTEITYNGSETRLTNDTVNNKTDTISTSTFNINDSSSVGFTTVTNKSPAETSTASHVLSLRTSTMFPSVDEILLNSISSAAKEDMAISTSTSSTSEPRILTLDIDPETKQIRTEKPTNGMGSGVFKFIPIDEITVAPQDTNVLRLATKSPIPVMTTTETPGIQSTEFNTETPQIPLGTESEPEATTTIQTPVGTTPGLQERAGGETLQTLTTQSFTNPTTSFQTEEPTTIRSIEQITTTTSLSTTATPELLNINIQNSGNPLQNLLLPRGRSLSTSDSNVPVRDVTTSKSKVAFKASETEIKQLQEDAKFLQALLVAAGQNPASLNSPGTQSTIVPVTKSTSPQTIESDLKQFEEDAKLLKALLEATGQNPANFQIPKFSTNPQTTSTTTSSTNVPITKPTSPQSIESDLKQFEEDAKLLKALLEATGQNPASFQIPKFNTNAQTTTTSSTTPPTTSTTTNEPITNQPTTSSSLQDDIRKFQEDAKLLQALLQATGQSASNFNLPVISGVTSNVRIASNPLTTSIVSNAPTTTPTPTVQPIFTRTQTTTPMATTSLPNLSVTNPFQSRSQTTTTLSDDIGISTTVLPYLNRRRQPTTTAVPTTTRRILRRPTTLIPRLQTFESSTITTEMPSSSTFSVEEDLAFLKNLKSVLNTNNDDPEKALANRIIALAVERSLNDIETNQPINTRAGKAISGSDGIRNRISTTTRAAPTTTTTTTTRRLATTRRLTTTPTPSTPSIEDDIRQFEQDSKLLQALLKATGQDPSKFNIPTITNAKTNVRPSPTTVSSNVNDELKLLSTLLASPSPLNEQFETLTPKTARPTPSRNVPTTTDSIKILQDDPKFLQSLVQLRGGQETTTLKTKLVNSGLTSDEALTKLLSQQKTMVSEATKSPVTVSTEYGKSNDALLAALLKEQGFGPTTASSLDEQLRLAALLNQVVVTPKTVRTTSPAPAPTPRRPILDGLSWLWQQWRETAPGPPRQNRRPVPTVTSSATSNRVNWFGSGPFVGNAPENTDSNRIPLEPPRAVAAEQTPGRGQIVSAAINVSRAFSQFLGAAIQGAAQTVQNVIKAGQKAASDVYVNGSG